MTRLAFITKIMKAKGRTEADRDDAVREFSRIVPNAKQWLNQECTPLDTINCIAAFAQPPEVAIARAQAVIEELNRRN